MKRALDSLFDRANVLNGLLHHMDAQLRWFRDSVHIDHADVIPHLTAGSCLVVRDLTERPSHGSPVIYASGTFSTSGQEYLDQVDVLTAREAAWVIAQGFESLETCVKDLLAAHYLAVPSAADFESLRKTEQRLARAGLRRDSLEFWSTYVRRCYKSADKVMTEIRRVAPKLGEAEVSNSRDRDLVVWFAALSEARHAVVHSDLVIAQRRWANLPEDQRAVVLESFSGTRVEHGVELRPTVRQATEALTGLVEYGYAAFKALSIAAGAEWRVFPNQGEQ